MIAFTSTKCRYVYAYCVTRLQFTDADAIAVTSTKCMNVTRPDHRHRNRQMKVTSQQKETDAEIVLAKVILRDTTGY